MRILRLTTPQMQGDDVRSVQSMLKRHYPAIAVDGIYGPRTKATVVRFQRAAKIAVDGVVGVQTLTALRRESFGPTVTVVSLEIVRHDWQWLRPLGKRIGKVPGIVEHHAAAATASPQDIDRWHKSRGYSGIGYHYLVRKDGSIHRGRPEWAMGAHCLGHNDWIGIVAEGNYDVEREMPRAQLAALVALRADLQRRHGKLLVRRHGVMPGNSTACPGRWYPFAKVAGLGVGGWVAEAIAKARRPA